jgi:hypothetical protein
MFLVCSVWIVPLLLSLVLYRCLECDSDTIMLQLKNMSAHGYHHPLLFVGTILTLEMAAWPFIKWLFDMLL